MNVIISNKYTSLLNELDIDVIKKLEGQYDVDDIINQFKNFFFPLSKKPNDSNAVNIPRAVNDSVSEKIPASISAKESNKATTSELRIFILFMKDIYKYLLHSITA